MKRSVNTLFQQLEEKGWMKIVAYGGTNNRAALYGTTREFLEHFGLNSIYELPNLEETIAFQEKILANRIEKPIFKVYIPHCNQKSLNHSGFGNFRRNIQNEFLSEYD